MSEWIKCGDRDPRDSKNVLLWCVGAREAIVGYLSHGVWCEEFMGCEVHATHWMPLPSPPKET